MSRLPQWVGVVLAVLLISACGGDSGGDGDAAVADPASGTPASAPERETPSEEGRVLFSAENAPLFLAGFERYTSLLQAYLDPFRTVSELPQGDVSAMAGVEIDLGPIVEVPDIGVEDGPAEPEDPEVGEPEPEPEPFPFGEELACSVSGTRVVSQNGTAEEFTLSHRFDGCVDGQRLLDGTITFLYGDMRDAPPFIGYHEVTLEGLRITEGADTDILLDGTVRFQANKSGDLKSLVFDATLVDRAADRIYGAADLRIQMPLYGKFGRNLGYAYPVSGAFEDADHGYALLSNEPDMRSVVMTGKSRSKVRLTMLQSIGERIIAVDVDGDASYESQRYLPW